MKTNFKSGILAIALLASVTGAFASEISNAITKKLPIPYSWQKYHTDGTPDGLPVQDDETSPFVEDCEGTASRCAVGTPNGSSGSQIVLRYE